VDEKAASPYFYAIAAATMWRAAIRGRGEVWMADDFVCAVW
jgi:hypothetical protein